MAGNKYISNNAGTLTEVAANQTSAGAADAGKIVGLNSAGQVDITMMPTGVGAEVSTILASEAISAGSFVNIYNNAGTANIRNADGSTSGKQADGFVLAAVSNGASGTVYDLGQINNAVSGATPGTVYLSDVTPGAVKSTAPSGSGKTVQKLGVATSATAISTASYPAIVLA